MDSIRTHPGDPTNPLRVGAPLPDELTIHPPRLTDIVDELIRAQVELLYAISEHRKAWTRVRNLHARIKGEGGFPDSDLTYKKATGDVTWWRGEMSAQADAVQALLALREHRQAGGVRRAGWVVPDLRPEPGERPRSVREIVEGWDGVTRPTRQQYDAAQVWINATGDRVGPMWKRRCKLMVEAYERGLQGD